MQEKQKKNKIHYKILCVCVCERERDHLLWGEQIMLKMEEKITNLYKNILKK